MIERSSAGELAALLRGAATLSRAGNRSAAIAALVAAVGLAPGDRTAHRRLAAAYAMAGDRHGARHEYERYVARLEARGSFDAAAIERAYAAVVLRPPSSRPLPVAARRRLSADQTIAVRRIGVAGVAIVATVAAMIVAGAQILASGGPL